MRTERSKTFLNPDGTHTLQAAAMPIHYWTGRAWADISNRIIPEPGGAGYRNEANSFTAHFHPGVVEVDTPQGPITMSPIGATLGAPTADPAGGTVTYANVWPGVDVRYRVENTGVKEELVVRQRPATTQFSFMVTGTSLSVRPDGGLALSGSFADTWMVPAPVVLAADGHVVSAALPHFSVSGTTVSLAVDPSWLAGLDASKDFPFVLDPSFLTPWSSKGESYERNSYDDGYITCGSNPSPCQPQVGISDTTTGWRPWRSTQYFAYESLFGKQILAGQVIIQSLQAGTANPLTMKVYGDDVNGQFGGIWNWSNLGALIGTGTATDSFIWDGATGGPLAQYYQSLVDRQLPGMALKFVGDETQGAYTYKDFGWFEIQLTYNDPAGIAQPVAPSNGAAVHTLTPTLQASASDPNGDPVQYDFRIATGSDAETGVVWDSGSTSSSSVAVPAGKLAFGTTYYWHAYSWDGYSASWTAPNWVWSLTPTNGAPAATNLSPGDGSLSTTEPALSATYTDPDADSGTLQFEISGVGTFNVGGLANGTVASYTPTLFPETGSYSWHVRAQDATGLYSDWSPWRTFSYEPDADWMQDDFTGTNGNPWNATNWTTSSGLTIGTTSTWPLSLEPGTQGIFPSATASKRATATGPSMDDSEVSLTYSFQNRNTGSSLRVTLRGSGATGANQLPNGYRIDIPSGSDTVTVNSVVNSTVTPLGSFTYPRDTNPQRLRFRVEGYDLYAKIWPAGTLEPDAWGIQVTDGAASVTQKGTLQIAHAYQTAGRSLSIDDVTYSPDLAPAEIVGTQTFTSAGPAYNYMYCTWKVQRPHNSRHVGGTVNVVVTGKCKPTDGVSQMQSMTVDAKLYRANISVGAGSKTVYGENEVKANAAYGPCQNDTYQGWMHWFAQGPPGYLPQTVEGQQYGESRYITC